MAEFLPLCDVLFNVISLAGYFCDVVFDVVLGYALYERQKFAYFTAVIVIVSFSLVISQIVSIRWYLNKRKIRNATASTAGPPGTTDDTPGGGTPGANSLEKKKKKTNGGLGLAGTGSDRSAQYSRYIVVALHVTQLGVLWRYAKLFVPVDLRHVKHEVRDLCMLRLVHAFCEAAPMLLLQLYVLVNLQSEAQLSALKLKTLGHHHLLPAGASATTALVQQTNLVEQQQKTFRDLNMVSATLSLFSVCWALASFSKNVRLQNVHRLVLTWLGVIFQFLWRLGTVISRVISLTVYASVYSHWVFLVIILHWFSMFLWLISPKNVFHGERISRLKKTTLGGLIAFVYIFAYINLQEVRHRQKMLTFYIVMFMENCLLVCLWMVGVWPNRPDGWYMIPVSVLCSFAAGLFFMVVYYRYFHVRRLGYEAGGRLAEKCSAHCPDGCRCPISHDVNGLDGAAGGANGAGVGVVGGKLANGGIGNCGVGGQKYPHAIPGVFNCRFSNPVNAATKRKKKKPTTFVPPPNLGVTSANGVAGGTAGSAIDQYNLNHQHHHQQQQQQQQQHHQQQQQHQQQQHLLHQQFQQHQQQQQMQHQHHQQQQHQPQLSTSNSNSTHSMGPMAIPFWRRPLPRSHTGGSSENEGSSVGSRVNIQQKLLEKKQKQLAELKIIEEEIKQGKLGGPGAGATGTLSSGDDGKTTLPRQPIPRAKKHIDLDPIEWRTSSPDMAEIVANKSFNDLNLLLAANLDDVNGLGKFSSNYDPIYNSFGLNGINISALVNLKGNGAAAAAAAAAVAAATVASAGPTPTLADARDCQPPSSSVLQGAARNMSPISSQISATESNSLTRHHQVPVVPRSKMILPGNIPRNPFAENYRGNFVNLYADAAANGNGSSAVTPGSTGGCQVNGGGAGNGNGTTVRAPSISPRTTEIAQSNRAILYDAHGRLYTDANHPRQVSGTYSNSNADNAGNTDNLPFPYNVVPPPRSKLDSRGTPSTPAQSGSASGSANNTNSSNKSARTATTATMVAVAACVSGGTSGSGPVTNPSGPSVPINNLNNTKRQNMQRAKTPEILLAPHYLENSRIYFDWVAREAANFRLQDTDRDHHPVESSGDENLDNSACDDGHGGHHRIPSDIDSQVSLPRSYTLPREFKYYRRNKGRKVKNEHFIASTNSSDGDVDSGDDNESERLSSNLSSSSQRRQKNATPCSNLVAVGSGQHHVVSLQSPTTQQQQQQHVNPHQRLNNLNKAGAAAALLSQSGAVGLKDTGTNSVAHQLYAGHGGSPSNTLLTAGGRQSLNATPQNLHHQPLTGQQGPGGGGSSSYNLRTASPGAMPVLPPNGVPGPLAAKVAVHNLDLISGVEALAGGNGGAMVPPYHGGGGGGGGGGRPMRFRMYGGTKNGMVRHETKL